MIANKNDRCDRSILASFHRGNTDPPSLRPTSIAERVEDLAELVYPLFFLSWTALTAPRVGRSPPSALNLIVSAEGEGFISARW